MKNKIFILIYIVCLLGILGAISTIALSDSFIEKSLSGIAGILSVVIFGGIWTRNEIGRKIAVYYFGFNAVFSLIIGVIGTLVVLNSGEYVMGLVSFIVTTITVALYVLMVRGLNNPKLDEEFN